MNVIKDKKGTQELIYSLVMPKKMTPGLVSVTTSQLIWLPVTSVLSKKKEEGPDIVSLLDMEGVYLYYYHQYK